jgi:hypothetical protein
VDTGGSISVGGTFANPGTININSGGTLWTRSFDNTGTINLNFGTLAINATFPTNLGNIVGSGSVALSLAFTPDVIANFPGLSNTFFDVGPNGTLNAAGTTLLINPGTYQFRLAGGTINAATITSTGGIPLVATRGVGTVNGATLNVDVTVLDGAAIVLNNTVQTGRTIQTQPVSGTSGVECSGTLTGPGGLTILFGGSGQHSVVRPPSLPPSGSLTLGSDVTIQTNGGGGTIGATGFSTINGGTILSQTAGQSISTAGTFTNLGVMRAASGAVLSMGSFWTNGGTIDIASGGSLLLGGSFTTASIGTITNAGSAAITGTLTASGSVPLNLDATGSWKLQGGTLSGVTVNVTSPAALGVSTKTSRMVGCSVNGDIVFDPVTPLAVSNGLILNGSVSGNGTMTLSGTPCFLEPSTGQLTIGPATWVVFSSGPNQIGAPSLSTVNQGTVDFFNGPGAIAGNFTNSGTVIVESGVSVTASNVTGTGTISNSGTLLFNGTNQPTQKALIGSGTTTLNAASLALRQLQQGTLSLTNGASAIIAPRISGGTLSTLSKVSLSADSKLDLADNDLILNYFGTSPKPQIAAALAAGYHNGDWSGPQLTSSAAATAAADSNALYKTALGYAEASALQVGTFDGRSVDTTTILIAYTITGDANLDRTVNTSDFTALAAHFGSTTAGWNDGDFNYDGVVNAIDFNVIATNFGSALPTASLGLVVPEPQLFAAACAFALTRRRRSRSR